MKVICYNGGAIYYPLTEEEINWCIDREILPYGNDGGFLPVALVEYINKYNQLLLDNDAGEEEEVRLYTYNFDLLFKTNQYYDVYENDVVDISPSSPPLKFAFYEVKISINNATEAVPILLYKYEEKELEITDTQSSLSFSNQIEEIDKLLAGNLKDLSNLIQKVSNQVNKHPRLPLLIEKPLPIHMEVSNITILIAQTAEEFLTVSDKMVGLCKDMDEKINSQYDFLTNNLLNFFTVLQGQPFSAGVLPHKNNFEFSKIQYNFHCSSLENACLDDSVTAHFRCFGFACFSLSYSFSSWWSAGCDFLQKKSFSFMQNPRNSDIDGGLCGFLFSLGHVGGFFGVTNGNFKLPLFPFKI